MSKSRLLVSAIVLVFAGGLAVASQNGRSVPPLKGELRIEQAKPPDDEAPGLIRLNPGGVVRLNATSSRLLQLHRHDNVSNVLMEFCLSNDHETTGKPDFPHLVEECVFIGQASIGRFAIGDNDLGSSSDRWLEVHGPHHRDAGAVFRSGPLRLQGGAVWLEHSNDAAAARSLLGMVEQMGRESRQEAMRLLARSGGGRNETDFAVGTILAVQSSSGHGRNASRTVRLGASAGDYTTDGNGPALDGTWRQRGRIAQGVHLFQRVQ